MNGASNIRWFGGYGEEIPRIDDFGSAVVFEAAFNSGQSVGIGFQPAASCRTKKWDAFAVNFHSMNQILYPKKWS